MNDSNVVVRRVGERALLVAAAHPAAAAVWVRTAAAGQGIALVDVVPAARTVLVSVPRARGLAAVRALLDGLPEDLGDLADGSAAAVDIAVRFDGPDLAAVAERAGTDPDGVARMLLDAELIVAFCGFAPGFAYLSGLPDVLHLPRRPEPRTRVPAGSVGLADEYAAVYPGPSPGGWNLVASTEQAMFDTDRDPPALLVAGSRVRLVERA